MVSPPTKRPPRGDTISTHRIFQILLALLAAWTLVAGVLIGVVGGTAGRILTGVEGNPPATHLIGAHFLLIVPIYVLLIRDMARYRWLLWFPFAAQAAVLVPALVDLFAGDRDFADAVVPILATSSFLAMAVAVQFFRDRPGGPQTTSVRPGLPGAKPGAGGLPALTPDLGGGRFKRTVVTPHTDSPETNRKPWDQTKGP